MGLFEFLKKQVINFEQNVNLNQDNKVKINKTDITSNDFKCNDNNTTILGKSNDNYTKEQVIALFLKSMSYRVHSLGKKDDYPRYMTYDYNILDVPKFHKELIDSGYFCNAPFEEILKDYKVNDLKELLINKDQNIKGLKKNELVLLALKNISEEEKQSIINQKKLYIVSQLGLDYMENYKEFLTVVDYKKYDINYSLYLEYKKKLSAYSTIRDIVWHIFNERLNLCFRNKQVSMIRSVYLHMAQFLEEEKENIDVLYYYILCLYYDINLDNTQQQILDFKAKLYTSKEVILDCIDDNPLAPGIISKIKEYFKYHDDKIYEKIFNTELLPYKFISDEEFIKMINDIYESSFFEEKRYTNIAVKKAKNIINQL